MTQLYGCHNRPREPKPVLVQRGWVEMGLHPNDSPTGMRERVCLPRMIAIPFTMSTDCRYDKSATDNACAGCEHARKLE
jgi:hypothetical protein